MKSKSNLIGRLIEAAALYNPPPVPPPVDPIRRELEPDEPRGAFPQEFVIAKSAQEIASECQYWMPITATSEDWEPRSPVAWAAPPSPGFRSSITTPKGKRPKAQKQARALKRKNQKWNRK